MTLNEIVNQRLKIIHKLTAWLAGSLIQPCLPANTESRLIPFRLRADTYQTTQ
jgi:hypothetical protein